MTEPDVFRWQDGQLTYLQEERPFALITTALNHLYHTMKDKGYNLRTPEYVLAAGLEFNYVLVGSGIVAFKVGTVWYSDDIVLCEEFVYGDLTLTDVRDALLALARLAGARRVVVGTFAVVNGRHSGLARMYESIGFRLASHELTIEVTPDG